MFRRIMVANRGEVAHRVYKTAKKLGIEIAFVYSDPDKDLAFLEDADDSRCIGGVRAYLDGEAMISAAREMKCSAIHPGWGFLSENPTFATQVEAVGLRFIGPKPSSMRRMSDKAKARETMRALGLCPIPGVDRPLLTIDDVEKASKEVGFPLLLKAVSGGGGRGMRKVFSKGELSRAFMEASAEAQSAFGDASLYMEKLIQRGRHIEFQVLSDGLRTVIVGERECSIQRRHQKLLEETPSVAVDDEQRKNLSAQIANAVHKLGYLGAGTIEMLRDDDGTIYFMEMNTRLQVEHTITEETWGIDLVEQQLRVAANQALTWKGEQKGHSIQCRINAEDVSKGFQPCPGQLTTWEWPEMEGVRIETHLRQGDMVSPFYDSMLAKVIATAPTRREAIALMQNALGKANIKGVPTTIDFHLSVLSHPRFVSGKYDTKFVEEELLK
jgi:acetyl-CoA carboxylase biotin carboxylase subunit